jgi:hypothetical protein
MSRYWRPPTATRSTATLIDEMHADRLQTKGELWRPIPTHLGMGWLIGTIAVMLTVLSPSVLTVGIAVLLASVVVAMLVLPLMPDASFVSIRPDALHIRSFYSDIYFRWEHIGPFWVRQYQPLGYFRTRKTVVWDYDGPGVHISRWQRLGRNLPEGALWAISPACIQTPHDDAEALAKKLNRYRTMYTSPQTSPPTHGPDDDGLPEQPG